jgi:hypothetical protein
MRSAFAGARGLQYIVLVRSAVWPLADCPYSQLSRASTLAIDLLRQASYSRAPLILV